MSGKPTRAFDLEHLRKWLELRELLTRREAVQAMAREYPHHYRGTLGCDAQFLDKKVGEFAHMLGERAVPTVEIVGSLEDLAIPYTDSLVFCDVHAPHHIEWLVHQGVAMAVANDVKQAIIVGDFLDYDCYSSYLKVSPSDPQDGYTALRALLDLLSDNFDSVLMCMGNHDERILRKLGDLGVGIDGILSLARGVTHPGWPKVKATSRFYIKLEDSPSGDWLLSHQDNYRKVPLSVASEGVIKYGTNFLTAHQHHLGAVRTGYGNKWAVDGGCIVDPAKTEYLQRRHKMCSDWAPGFTLLLDGHPYVFRGDEPAAVWARWGA